MVAEQHFTWHFLLPSRNNAAQKQQKDDFGLHPAAFLGELSQRAHGTLEAFSVLAPPFFLCSFALATSLTRTFERRGLSASRLWLSSRRGKGESR